MPNPNRAFFNMRGFDILYELKQCTMKKQYIILAVAIMAAFAAFVSCDHKKPSSQFVGTYDLDMVYDSLTTSDGTWFDEEFYETMTGKINPPEHGYLTIAEGPEGKLTVTATFVKESGEKTFFSTTATEVDNTLVLDDCISDYYYASTEENIRFTFHNFQNNMPTLTFKSIYTINLGLDYSYLTEYTCVKQLTNK